MSLKIRPDVTIQHVGNESLVLDMESGQIHQLNATAAWILEQCDGEKSVDSITKEFAELFSLDTENAKKDVDTVIGQLNQLGIIIVD